MKRKVTGLISAVIVALMATFFATSPASAAPCPPDGALWSSDHQFTGEPDNYGGQIYSLNNGQYNMQPTSHQVMYLMSVGGAWGICQVFQPSGHGVTAFPGIAVGTNGMLPGNAINSYTGITVDFDEQGFNAGAVDDSQFMTDVWVNDTAGNSDAIEVEMVPDRHETAWPPPGQTFVGQATLTGLVWDVYTATAISDHHTYYAFYPDAGFNGGSRWFQIGTLHIMGALQWLHANASPALPLTDPLLVISSGWEISDASNGSGGTISGPVVNSYAVNLSP